MSVLGALRQWLGRVMRRDSAGDHLHVREALSFLTDNEFQPTSPSLKSMTDLLFQQSELVDGQARYQALRHPFPDNEHLPATLAYLDQEGQLFTNILKAIDAHGAQRGSGKDKSLLVGDLANIVLSEMANLAMMDDSEHIMVWAPRLFPLWLANLVKDRELTIMALLHHQTLSKLAVGAVQHARRST